MFRPLRALLLSAVVVTTAFPFWGQTIVNFDFGAVPIGCPNGYAYQGAVLSCPYTGPSQNFNADPSFGWILGTALAHDLNGGAGLTGPSTVFFPPPFTGLPFNQAVFLQGETSLIRQNVGGFTAGSYTLSFYLGSRYSYLYDGNQTIQALIDGNVIGTWALTSYTPFTLPTASFSVTTAGIHTVEFLGINRGDHTAFLSYVVIAPTGR